MKYEISSPVINENHRLLITYLDKITARIQAEDYSEVHELFYQLFNRIERYYTAHSYLIKKKYCVACEQQMQTRQTILNRLMDICSAFAGEHWKESLHMLHELKTLLSNTMYQYQFQ